MLYALGDMFNKSCTCTRKCQCLTAHSSPGKPPSQHGTAFLKSALNEICSQVQRPAQALRTLASSIFQYHHQSWYRLLRVVPPSQISDPRHSNESF